MTTALLPRIRALLADRRVDGQSDAELLKAFVASRDEQAFAALVRRHGPLVLATARRATGNPADADDVFQATFLLLAKHAAAIRKPAAVAGWLHGTASRVARTARRAAARRRTHEARAARPRPSAHCELTWRKVQQAFEEELGQLPNRYRVPFVLCVLNGEARADVARRLGIREGTISSRLAVAKRRLQERLTARGISLAVVLGAATLPTVTVSAEMVHRCVRTAFGQPVPGAVSALLRGSAAGLRSAGLIAAAMLAGTLVLAALGRPGDVAGSAPPPKQPPAPVADPPKEKVAVRGTALDADGKPVAGAPVRLWSFRVGEQIPEPRATTDDAGHFQFDAAPGDRIDEARVVVTPKGRPAQWLPLAKFTSEQTLRLPKDDVPFTGLVASLENQPLKGVTVQVVRVSSVADGELGPWVEKNVAMRKQNYWLNEDELVTVPGGLVLPAATATTDADGKFKLTGFGRDRVLTVKVFGPNVETKFFWVVSRPGGPAGGHIRTRDFNHGLYGPDVTVLLAPSRPLVGTVRDKKTGRPVAGAVVSEVNNSVPKSVTDKDGKYRLEGVPKKSHYGLNVAGARGVPIFDFTHMWVADVAGLDALQTDLAVTRGIELTGRVADADGKPVRAEAMYFPHGDKSNELLTVISSDGYRTAPDGTFYVTVHPGPGVLTIQARELARYAPADPEPALVAIRNRSRGGPVNAVIPLDVDPSKPETLTVLIKLEPATTVKGTVLGPDGKPLAGARAAGLTWSELPKVLPAAGFTMARPRPGVQRLVVVVHEEKKLAAVHPVSGDSADLVTIKLAALGSAGGRVMKSATEPGVGFTVTAVASVPTEQKFDNLPNHTMKIQGLYGISRGPWRNWTNRKVTADKDGRFRLDGLLPGLTYTLYVTDGDLGEAGTLVTTKRDVTVEAGKENDLGELKR